MTQTNMDASKVYPSVVYSCKDPVRSTDSLLVICAVHVYVGEEEFDTAALQVVTKEATSWLGTDNSALYVLHVFPRTNKLDLSFADTNSDLLIADAEQKGIQPFLHAVAAAKGEWSAVMSLQFETLQQLRDAQYQVSVAFDASTEQHCAALAAFLRLCATQ